MSKALSGPVVAGVLIAVVVVLAIVGFRYFGGGKSGEKPSLDPMINRMYSPPPPGGLQTPSAPAPQGR